MKSNGQCGLLERSLGKQASPAQSGWWWSSGGAWVGDAVLVAFRLQVSALCFGKGRQLRLLRIDSHFSWSQLPFVSLSLLPRSIPSRLPRPDRVVLQPVSQSTVLTQKCC
jgi:hypothetical protein